MLTHHEVLSESCPYSFNPHVERFERNCVGNRCPKWRPATIKCRMFNDFPCNIKDFDACKVKSKPYHSGDRPWPDDDTYLFGTPSCEKCPKRFGYCGG